jgi:hypothetical protein
MLIARALITLSAVFLLVPAGAQSQQSVELSRLLAHIVFYAPPNGRPAEFICFLREAQRLNFAVSSPKCNSAA